MNRPLVLLTVAAVALAAGAAAIVTAVLELQRVLG